MAGIRTRSVDSRAATTDGRTLPAFSALPVVAIAAATVALLVAVGSRYGYHRDELYFLEETHHLAFGFVDQPPMAIVMTWVARVGLGGSPTALRLFTSLADGTNVVLAALVARELGGGRFPQILTSAAVALAPVYLISAHTANTTPYDQLAWTAVALLVIRILRTGNDRLWLPVGLVLGVALEFKETILLLVAGLAIGLLVNRQADLLRSPWLWAGVAAALLLWAPNLAWEAAHHWPVFEMDRKLHMEHSGLGDALKFPGFLILMPDPFLAPVWLGGLWALWRGQRFRPYRPLAVAFAVALVFIIVTIADRAYYIAPLFTVLFAAGWILTEDVLRGVRGFFRDRPRRPLLWRSTGAVAGVFFVGSVIGLPLSLPLLPARVLATVPLQSLNYDMGEEIGWQQLVLTVAQVWRSIPPEERSTTAIVTANYGEAGAIDRYGSGFGLPGASSGHNTYWWWGPPRPSLGTTIAVGFDAAQLTPYFSSVRQVATIHNGLGVANDEEGAPVWLCRGQRAPWPHLWPRFKDYG